MIHDRCTRYQIVYPSRGIMRYIRLSARRIDSLYTSAFGHIHHSTDPANLTDASWSASLHHATRLRHKYHHRQNTASALENGFPRRIEAKTGRRCNLVISSMRFASHDCPFTTRNYWSTRLPSSRESLFVSMS